jgi:hypothetical protein
MRHSTSDSIQLWNLPRCPNALSPVALLRVAGGTAVAPAHANGQQGIVFFLIGSGVGNRVAFRRHRVALVFDVRRKTFGELCRRPVAIRSFCQGRRCPARIDAQRGLNILAKASIDEFPTRNTVAYDVGQAWQ